MEEAAGDRVLIEDLTDGLGVRRRTTDSLCRSTEVLTLRDELVAHACFEFAVRERVLTLREFQHRAFPPVLSVECVGLRSLTVTTAAADGTRLSDVVGPQTAANVPWSLRVISRLLHALAALHALGRENAHGAVSALRLHVTDDAQVFVGDYVLGSALAQLCYTRDQYADLDVALPSHHDRFDGNLDVFQSALVALELLAGSCLTRAERRGDARDLLATLKGRAGFEGGGAVLEPWLVRALQITTPFGSSAEALAELDRIVSQCGPVIPLAGAAGHVPASQASRARVAKIRPELEPLPTRDAVPVQVRAVDSETIPIDDVVTIEPEPPEGLFVFDEEPVPTPPVPLAWNRTERRHREVIGLERRFSQFQSNSAVAIVLLVVLGTLSYADSKSSAARGNGSPVRPMAVALNDSIVGTGTTATVIRASDPPAGHVDAIAQPPSTIGASLGPAPKQSMRSTPITVSNDPDVSQGHPPAGSLTITSPFEFQAFEGGRLIADTDKRHPTLAAGAHDLVFVNDRLGFRTTKRVYVTATRSTTIVLEAPVRLAAINADPWADVVIDEIPVGQTPLGRVPVRVGVHNVVFRHPTFGEQHRVVRVPATGEVRISVRMK